MAVYNPCIQHAFLLHSTYTKFNKEEIKVHSLPPTEPTI